MKGCSNSLWRCTRFHFSWAFITALTLTASVSGQKPQQNLPAPAGQAGAIGRANREWRTLHECG